MLLSDLIEISLHDARRVAELAELHVRHLEKLRAQAIRAEDETENH